MGNKNLFKIGVFGIIFNKEKGVLLCHRRDYDLWNLPGGGLEKNESPWEGVVREVREETGLIVEIQRLSGIYSKPDQSEIVFSFACNVIAGKVACNDEADRIEYFKFDKIPSNTSPKQLERIKDAFESSEVVMKVQRGLSSIDLLKQGELK